MSGFDMETVTDAELDAFLRGKDDLSALLRAVPQPKPAADAGAALLAMVEADLAEQEKPVSAANEEEFAPGQTPSRPFFQRWRVSLALAASAFVVSALGVQWYKTLHKEDAMVEVAQASVPEVSAVGTAPVDRPAAGPESAKPEMKAAPQADTRAATAIAEQVAKLEKTAQAERMEEKQVKAEAQVTSKKSVERAERALAQPSPGESKERTADSLNKSRAAPAAEVLAQAPAADTAGAPSAAYSAKDGMRDAANHQLGAERARQQAEARQVADAKRQSELLARAETEESARAAAAIGKNKLMAAPPAPAAGAAAPVAASPPIPVKTASAGHTAAEHAASTAEAGAKTGSEQRAKAWLQLVDELIKAKMLDEALQEWAKFRKVYPQYPVAERLQEQIKQLQKAEAERK